MTAIYGLIPGYLKKYWRQGKLIIQATPSVGAFPGSQILCVHRRGKLIG